MKDKLPDVPALKKDACEMCGVETILGYFDKKYKCVRCYEDGKSK